MLTTGETGARVTSRVRTGLAVSAVLAVALSTLVWPGPAAAWQHGWGFGPGMRVVRSWGPGPGAFFPGAGPLPGYRFAFPPGAPLAYSDPGNGTTYCLSQQTGFYYECGYAPSALMPVGPVATMPPGVLPSPADLTARPASAVLVFRLSRDAEATVDGVPIGLSEGLGIIAVSPGRHQVALRISGKETEHTVTVGPHRILTVTPTTIVATEP
ncbi:MAG TPA: hypothetical protein VLT62_15195 [Candidatus Methylomirabilis sp.]|nr:hypothetical protein [Candidatus Methylomirabilis sp.]